MRSETRPFASRILDLRTTGGYPRPHNYRHKDPAPGWYSGNGRPMSQVEKIEDQIAELSAADLAALRRWFAEFDANVWDRQFEFDAMAGKLERLAENALQEHDAGRSTKF